MGDAWRRIRTWWLRCGVDAAADDAAAGLASLDAAAFDDFGVVGADRLLPSLAFGLTKMSLYLAHPIQKVTTHIHRFITKNATKRKKTSSPTGQSDI